MTPARDPQTGEEFDSAVTPAATAAAAAVAAAEAAASSMLYRVHELSELKVATVPVPRNPV